jgi:hypothetical protein
LLAVVAGLVLAVAAPAAAMAAVLIGITSTPAGFAAGGDPTLTNTITLDGAAGPAGSTTLALAPGVLANLNSNPACLAAVTHTAECQIGDGTVAPVAASLTAYLVPSTSPLTNAAGVDLVIGAPISATLHGELTIGQLTSGPSNGNVQGTLTLGASPGGLTGITLNLDGTLPGGSHAGARFTQMPTNCATPNPATHLSVAYASPESADASPDVAPTGCSGLAYAPAVSDTAVKDTADSGVVLTANITQASGQANNKSASLSIPAATVSPNASLLGVPGVVCTDPSFATCTHPIGTANAVSPLVPVSSLSPLQNGKVYLTNFGGVPGVTVHFGAPFAFNLSGAFSNLVSANPTLTFGSLPDIPLTALQVVFTGGPNAAFVSPCTSPNGTLTAALTGQNGVSVNRTAPVTVQGCPSVVLPGKPTVSGVSVGGVAKRKAHVKFKVNAGTNAPNIKSFSVKLQGGLNFTKKFKKGLKVTCGGAFTAKRSGHTLKITMKTAAASVCVSLTRKALSVSKGLAKQVQKKKVKKLKFTWKITDAKGNVTTITQKVKVS